MIYTFDIKITPVVKNILIINLLFFSATHLIDYNFIIYNFGVFYFDSFRFRIWQIITYMFIHIDLSHILFNMYALFIFGQQLENFWGSKKFLQYYIITGVGALLIHMIFMSLEINSIIGQFTIKDFTNIPQEVFNIYNIPIIGASGVVFGLLLAFGIVFPNILLHIIIFPIPIKAKYFIIIYGLFELLLGIMKINGDKIAHFAHIGGIICGYILIKIWQFMKY